MHDVCVSSIEHILMMIISSPMFRMQTHVATYLIRHRREQKCGQHFFFYVQVQRLMWIKRGSNCGNCQLLQCSQHKNHLCYH